MSTPAFPLSTQLKTMTTSSNNVPSSSERRDFLKKSGVAAGAAAAAGFPSIISAQSVTNSLKVGLVGAGGRGSGAAAQALSADKNTVLTAVADIDQAIVSRAVTRLSGSQKFGTQVKVDNALFGLDAYDKVINSGVDVVLLASPPGFRPAHLKAAVDAGKHIFCEKPAATDAPGIRSVMESQKAAQAKNIALVCGFCWRYNNMISAAIEQVHGGALGRLVAHYSTYYTNPVKPMPPESARPAGMGDVEWQVRNWYNFVWLSGDSLVEQAVHNADKIMWVMKDQPPASCVSVGGRSVPANGGNIYDHFEANFVYPNGYRVFLANRQSTGCFNGTLDYVMGTEGTLFLGKGKPRIETPDGKIKWQWEGEEYDMYQKEHDVLFASIRSGKPKNDDLNLATSSLLAIMGRDAAYSGQEVTWEQAMNSTVSLLPTQMDMSAKFEAPGLAIPGRTKVS
ncbi:Inositol 2-dehydrogenase [Luteitalea pratensis]|uniref:Inositol 2-dehydrogenase n=2 Tax=Luteitalea pratensis TaxID=1855912 RepID=A0A143PHZ0_LUTPR|nr:Inositol 2-dehydrogenase [Luteitalea pratensis]